MGSPAHRALPGYLLPFGGRIIGSQAAPLPLCSAASVRGRARTHGSLICSRGRRNQRKPLTPSYSCSRSAHPRKAPALRFALRLAQRRLNVFWSKGNLPDPCARGVEDGICNRRGHDGDGSLACAGCIFVRPIDQLHFELRYFEAQWQAVVACPVDRSHLLIVPRHLFTHGAAHALQSAAFNLITQTIWIRDRTRVIAEKYSLHR